MTPREKFILIIIGVFIVLVVLGTILTPSKKPKNNVADLSSISFLDGNDVQERKNRICLGRYCFEVELALTALQRNKGLMYRKSLDYDKGMLFIFNNSRRHTFWMKNTLIPLDIIWIDKDYRVSHISHNTQPCEDGKSCPVIRPDNEALYVLEINGGIAKKIGLKNGHKVYFNIK